MTLSRFILLLVIFSAYLGILAAQTYDVYFTFIKDYKDRQAVSKVYEWMRETANIAHDHALDYTKKLYELHGILTIDELYEYHFKGKDRLETKYVLIRDSDARKIESKLKTEFNEKGTSSLLKVERPVHKLHNGDSYQGYIENGKKVGFGIYRWADGDVFEGEYLNGKKVGFGIYRWANGDVFEGEYLNGHIWKGIYKFGSASTSPGSIFEGTFVNSKKLSGRYRWPSGTEFVGNFDLETENPSQGTLRWPDGDEYEGNYLFGELVYRYRRQWLAGLLALILFKYFRKG